MQTKYVIAGLVLMLGQPLCAAVQIDGVAAFVNAHVITVSDVLGASSTLQQQLRDGRGGRAANEMFSEVLGELIDRKLIADSYQQQREIQIPPMVVDERVQEIIQEMFRDDRNAFLRALGEEGRSERSWREEIREQVVVRAMRNLRVDRHIRISPTEVRAWYDANPEQFVRQDEVTYRMLVVEAPAQDATTNAVEQVTALLEAGGDFTEITQQYSIDRFAERGGLREPVDPQQLRTEVREALETLEIGAFTGPIALGENMIWLQLENRVHAEKVPFEEASEMIRAALFRERAEAKYSRWLSRLRSDAFITVTVDQPF